MEESRTSTKVSDAEAPPPSDAKAPMKFSFTVPKSSSSSRPPLFPKADRHKEADAEMVEYVSVFDGKGRDPAQGPVKVIPLPEKSWRPEKRMKNIMVASEHLPSTDEIFEVETLHAGPQPSVQYGLQLIRKPSDSAENNVPEVAVDRDLQRYRDDIALLPDEMSVDDYDNIPVEDFGEALLRGMGWEKDKPIGLNTTTISQPIVPVRRTGREGLGAIPAPQPEKVKKFIKPGESRETKLTVGRIMCIIGGVHAGSRGQIAEVNGSLYTVALLESGKRVRVKEDELAEVGSPEEEKAIKKLSELHIERNNDFDNRSKRSSNEERRKHNREGDARRDGRLSADMREVLDQRKRDERMRSSHRKDGGSKSREEVDDGNDNRHRSRKDSSDKHYSERGFKDGTEESRHQKHKSRREDGDDVSRGQRGHEEKNSRHETREDKNTLDSTYEKNSRRSESRGHSSDVYNKEKSTPSETENSGVKHKSRREDTDDASRGQHDREEKNSRHETREDKNILDSTYEKNSRRSESRGQSSDVYSREKSTPSGKENLGVKGGVHAEDSVGYSEKRMQSWLARDIRVRIIDKRAYGDKCYLQKACVVDVVSPSLCDIQMDEGGRLIEKVKQEHLETALPKRGGRVLVVSGKYRGQVGRLRERDSEKGIGLVQLEDDYDVLSFDLDHLAEFVGVLHEMEQ